MISIGDFSFPPRTTTVQVYLIEAKSKVRKEIRILSMLEEPADELQKAVESFDRGEASLSIHPGRFYQGRRRKLHINPTLPPPLVWVDLLVLTNDRYERSSSLHTQSKYVSFGQADFELDNAGNWDAPISISIQPADPLLRVEILSGSDPFVINQSLTSGSILEIDSENRRVVVDGINCYSSANKEFPLLMPGSHLVTVQVEPADAEVLCTVRYRDFWI